MLQSPDYLEYLLLFKTQNYDGELLTLYGVVLVSPDPRHVSRSILFSLLSCEEVVLGVDPVALPQRALVSRGGEEGEEDGQLLHLPEVPRHVGDVGLRQIYLSWR